MDPHEVASAAKALICGAGFGARQAVDFVEKCNEEERRDLAALHAAAKPGELRKLLDRIADRQRPPSREAAPPAATDQVRVRGKKRRET